MAATATPSFESGITQDEIMAHIHLFRPDTTVREILGEGKAVIGQQVTVTGSLRRFRVQGTDDKRRMFGHIDDGSGPTALQFFYGFKDGTIPSAKVEELAERGSPGASICVTGTVVDSPAKGQDIELTMTDFVLIDTIQDRETFQYGVMKRDVDWDTRLRTIFQDTYGRPRDQLIQCLARVRSQIKFGIFAYFIKQGFIQIDTPILTQSDCEGAGEMFQVTTLDLEHLPRTEDGRVDYSQDFFKQSANLTVSGQLEAEAWAQRLQKVFTFGPTFRAEKSMTSRHLAEFWMMEPELVFTDPDISARYHKLLDLEESMLKFVIWHVIAECLDDLKFLESTISPGLIEQLLQIVTFKFIRMSYTDAIEMLQQAVAGGHEFEESTIEWGMDLASEHEKYVVEQCGGPVFLMHYPQDLKSFYMKADEGCAEGRQTCQAVDLLVPGIGELCGGSMREDDPDKLIGVMLKKGVPVDQLQWYIDLRRDGGKPTGGFGLGFERLVRFITGAKNIRDVIAFPRFPGHI